MVSLRLNDNYQQEIATVHRLALKSGLSRAKIVALSVRLLEYLEERDAVQLQRRGQQLDLEYDSVNDQRLQDIVNEIKGENE